MSKCPLHQNLSAFKDPHNSPLHNNCFVRDNGLGLLISNYSMIKQYHYTKARCVQTNVNVYENVKKMFKNKTTTVFFSAIQMYCLKIEGIKSLANDEDARFQR